MGRPVGVKWVVSFFRWAKLFFRRVALFFFAVQLTGGRPILVSSCLNAGFP